MILTLSAPSKTYLTGEYAVLVEGPGIMLNTQPRFTLRASSGTGLVSGIPKGSPSDKWLDQRSPLLRDWNLEFHDPHAGQGGFGASGAQFLLVHAFTTFLQSSVSRAVEGYDLEALWNDYFVLSGGVTSGADVLGQSVGRVALIDMSTHSAMARPWPFADLGFAIVRTQHKLATHHHLADLDRGKLKDLAPLAHACAESFNSGASRDFLRDAAAFVTALENHDLQAPATRKITDRLRAQPWCRLAKGCGALGADTILVLFNETDRADALAGLINYDPTATDEDLSTGLEMNWKWS